MTAPARAAAVELAIVGAGVIGAAAAYLAAAAGRAHRVLVLERGRVGASGATACSAALAPRFGRDARVRALSERAHVLLRAWGEALSAPLEAVRLLWITRDTARLRPLLERAPEPAPEPVTAEAAPPGAAGDPLRVPAGRTVLADRAVRCPDPAGWTRRLLAPAAAPGVIACWEGAAVAGLEANDGGCELRLADGRRVAAARVIVADGPWVLEGPAGAAARARGVRRKKIVALHIDAAPPPGAAAAVFVDEEAFLLPMPERAAWLLSITSRGWDCPTDPARLDITPDERAHGLALLERYAPALAERCTGGRAFCDAYTPDGGPAMITHGERCAIVTGASGAGFRLAPALAEEALARVGLGAPDPREPR